MIRLGAETGINAIRPADDKGQIAPPGITPCAKTFGESGGGFDLAALIQHADHRPLGDGAPQQNGLGSHAAVFLIFHLDHTRRTKAQTAPGPVEPGEIIIDKSFFGTGAKPAHGAEMYPHGLVPQKQDQCGMTAAASSPPSHIFSSW